MGARNPFAILSRSPKEWGRKARKEEDHNRGFRSRGQQDAIREAALEMLAVEDEDGVSDCIAKKRSRHG